MSIFQQIIHQHTKDFPAIPPLTSRFAIRLFQSNQFLYILHPCDYNGEIAVWFCKYEKKGEQFSLGPNSHHLITVSQFPTLFPIFETALRYLNTGNYSFYLPIDFSAVDHVSSYLTNRVTLTLSHYTYPFAMVYDMHIPYSDFQSLVPLLQSHLDDIDDSYLAQAAEFKLKIE